MLPSGRPSVDLTGRRFGRLLVIETVAGTDGAFARCICDCGTEKIVRRCHLQRGNTRSCGCLMRDLTKERNRRHGAATGGVLTAEYIAWLSMHRRVKGRCFEHYESYTRRGITVCERWNDFATFLADMGPKPTSAHTIDRINVDGNYEPGNCRWATKKEQARNRRPRRSDLEVQAARRAYEESRA